MHQFYNKKLEGRSCPILVLPLKKFIDPMHINRNFYQKNIKA